ncbi:hypothetical protein D1BOALGB6SA_6221 [Olavius sp. associated proteobacterium Delta 1]|nr:hypothetical protein D1BOALGB6SA_6221 [Olavius sp. associated proteobacterium Delta 1]
MLELFPELTKGKIAKPATELNQRNSADNRARGEVHDTVLKCAFIFLTDLVRHLAIPEKVDFNQAAVTVPVRILPENPACHGYRDQQ